MLNSQALERATHSYRRGYRDGYDGKPVDQTRFSSDPMDRPFSKSDYMQGREAGRNDRYWDDIPMADKRDPAKRAELLANRPSITE
jgi:hypothetical protein